MADQELGVSTVIEETLNNVRKRNNFYRNAFRSMVGALLFMLLITTGLIGFLGYIILQRPKPVYYATSNDGRLIRLTSLSTPALSQAELVQWASRVAVAAYNYDFVNYRTNFNKLRDDFTASGFNQFTTALRVSGGIEKVLDEKLRVTAVATGAAIIVDQGIVGGHYAWKIQVPVLVTYESASGETERRPVIIELIITRVSTLETPKGIAVTHFFTRNTAGTMQ